MRRIGLDEEPDLTWTRDFQPVFMKKLIDRSECSSVNDHSKVREGGRKEEEEEEEEGD